MASPPDDCRRFGRRLRHRLRDVDKVRSVLLAIIQHRWIFLSPGSPARTNDDFRNRGEMRFLAVHSNRRLFRRPESRIIPTFDGSESEFLSANPTNDVRGLQPQRR